MIFETNFWFAVFINLHPISYYFIFWASEYIALVLKDLQPSRAEKASRPPLGISLTKVELG